MADRPTPLSKSRVPSMSKRIVMGREGGVEPGKTV